jgi:hypothetical protein
MMRAQGDCSTLSSSGRPLRVAIREKWRICWPAQGAQPAQGLQKLLGGCYSPHTRFTVRVLSYMESKLGSDFSGPEHPEHPEHPEQSSIYAGFSGSPYPEHYFLYPEHPEQK